ncbi:unnamed protein product [Sympodiomycopsis kandeliae]
MDEQALSPHTVQLLPTPMEMHPADLPFKQAKVLPFSVFLVLLVKEVSCQEHQNQVSFQSLAVLKSSATYKDRSGIT